MSTLDPAKLKVVELRQELTSRGLDAKGNKPVLVKRLKEALEKELQRGGYFPFVSLYSPVFNRSKYLNYIVISSIFDFYASAAHKCFQDG